MQIVPRYRRKVWMAAIVMIDEFYVADLTKANQFATNPIEDFHMESISGKLSGHSLFFIIYCTSAKTFFNHLSATLLRLQIFTFGRGNSSLKTEEEMNEDRRIQAFWSAVLKNGKMQNLFELK